MTPETFVTLFATLACGYVDARTGFIPNRITYPAFAATLILAAAQSRFDTAAQGALFVGGTLALLYGVTRGRGLGLGDVKLAACMGAGLGSVSGMIALGSSYIAGGVFAGYLLLSGKAERKTPIRFGPFLALGSLLALALGTVFPQWR